MSDFADKLAKLATPPRRQQDDVARQRLGQLRKRWGVRPFTGKAPELIEVDLPHPPGLERWKRIGGAAGEDTTYELQRGAP